MLKLHSLLARDSRLILGRLSSFSTVNTKFESSIFLDEDNVIDLDKYGKTPHYKGSLVIVPTPIGNLADVSLRQY